MDDAYQQGVDRYKLAIAIARHAKHREYSGDIEKAPFKRQKHSPVVQTIHEMTSQLEEKGQLPEKFLHFDQDDLVETSDDPFLELQSQQAQNSVVGTDISPPPNPSSAVVPDSDVVLDGDGGAAKLQALNLELLQAEEQFDSNTTGFKAELGVETALRGTDKSEDDLLLETILSGFALDDEDFDDPVEDLIPDPVDLGVKQDLTRIGESANCKEAVIPTDEDHAGDYELQQSLFTELSLSSDSSFDAGAGGMHPGDS